MEEPSRDVLEDRIGYHFKNRYLLECALTHTSYANEQKIRRYEDYERLEFLGDAVLEMISSAFLYEKYPDKHEGDLTKIRASLVCEPALAYCARDIQLQQYIRLGKGEEGCGGRAKDSITSDVMEALIGAMYLDSGNAEAPKQFIMRFILSDLEGKLLFYDAKSILQEQCQKNGGTVTYDIINEDGPSHMRTYTAAVLINGEEKERGTGHSKKAAEQEAAYRLLLRTRQKEQHLQ
ncbi:MAG: ribonuclease III [Lachnospiraceae bacterium]|nr:ribonuclease III [Lachnospiraceae bacterium]